MVKKNPNPVDVHVGGRVRMRRILIGLSQEKLGEQLGLTFQQVQKYEKGSNRISASRLWQMSKILGVPVAFFFEDIPENDGAALQPGFGESAGEGALMDFLSSADGFQLNRAFSQIEDGNVRRKLVELAKVLADPHAAVE